MGSPIPILPNKSKRAIPDTKWGRDIGRFIICIISFLNGNLVICKKYATGIANKRHTIVDIKDVLILSVIAYCTSTDFKHIGT
ncbi:hypothetical protein QCW_2412 [Clostridioides difficile CD69]|nr:hypothetical protein QCW_2412 [Clostridioides difficile CD69]